MSEKQTTRANNCSSNRTEVGVEWRVVFRGEFAVPQSVYVLVNDLQPGEGQAEPSLSPDAPLLVGVPAESCVVCKSFCKPYHTTEWMPMGELMNDGRNGVRCVCGTCGCHQWFCSKPCFKHSGWSRPQSWCPYNCDDCKLWKQRDKEHERCLVMEVE